MNDHVKQVLELAADKSVLEYDPYYPEIRPGSFPVDVDDEALAYCRDKGWVVVQTQHAPYAYKVRPNVFEPCIITTLTLTREGRSALYEANMVDDQSANRTGGRKRTGRPRKDEKDSATKVIAALTKHHGYENGSVTNFEPATNRGIAHEYGLSQNALSRFLNEKLGKGNPKSGGHKGYIAACNRDARIGIGALLTLWQGEVPERLAELLPHESGRDDED